MKRDIKSLRLSELNEHFISTGEQSFRAKQVFSWLHTGVKSFTEMTNLPKKLREKLDSEFFISFPGLLEKQISSKDSTIKYLLHVLDNDTVECVLMKYSYGNTICISTQIGCRMGCTFCASSIDGFKRNLSASEMLDQVLFVQQDSGVRVSNVVLMGIGEPLDNFDNIMNFIGLLNRPEGINIGARHITISTCGIVENIDRLAEYDVQLTLAISLHAPDDETRSKLIPINREAGVELLFEAADRYFAKTGRRVTYEYAMIDNVNDTVFHANLLSTRLKGTSSHLNLILLNNVQERSFKASTKESIDKFIEILKRSGVNYTIRRSLGADIEASCGQLRRRIMHSSNTEI